MTLEEARGLTSQAERVNLTVLAVYAQPNRTRDYSLVIEPVEGNKQIFRDAIKAHIALTEWSAMVVREQLRYFVLGNDGVPKECDAGAWKMDLPHRKGIGIPCGPQVTAVIHFIGLAPPNIDEKSVKLWAVNLNLATETGSYGTVLFRSFEEANIFVNQYKAKGCPSKSAFLKFRAQYHRQNSDREQKIRKAGLRSWIKQFLRMFVRADSR